MLRFLLQVAQHRRTGPRLSLASAQVRPGTGQDRYFQSLLLRRSIDCARPSHPSKSAEVARRNDHEAYLGPAVRGHQRVRTVLDSKWSGDSKILLAHFEGRAKEAVPRAAGRSEEELEILHGRRERTRLLEGLPGGLRRDDSEYSDEARAVVRSSCG